MKRLIALLLAVIMVLSMAACGKNQGDATPDEPTGGATSDEATQPTEAAPYIPELGEGVYSKISYSADNQTVLDNRDLVVATAGGRELTLGVLQIYYWMSVYGFLNEYGAYASYFGLDLTKPLDQQKCPDSEGTWQQYFLEYAVETWHSYQCMALQGEAEKSPMDPEMQSELDALETSMAKSAQDGKYDSVDLMLQTEIAPGITYDDYVQYLTVYYSSVSHYMHRRKIMQITDDMIAAYFDENQEAMAEANISKEEGKVVDVRHILISPHGGTTDENGATTYSDDEWTAAEKKAQQVLDLWNDGAKDEDFFAQLAELHTEDPGSAENGGLYENVKTGDMKEEFDAWCFDASRKYGDTGIVKTTYGYHVMFFSGEEALWIHECREALRSKLTSEFVNAAVDAHELHADYEKIILGHVDLAG
jgi:hypothetical protein